MKKKRKPLTLDVVDNRRKKLAEVVRAQFKHFSDCINGADNALKTDQTRQRQMYSALAQQIDAFRRDAGTMIDSAMNGLPKIDSSRLANLSVVIQVQAESLRALSDRYDSLAAKYETLERRSRWGFGWLLRWFAIPRWQAGWFRWHGAVA